MIGQVLVAYASKHGSTAEIAEQIGAVLADAGLPVHVAPVGEVTEMAPYSAVVLGSAVYMGRWRREASRFVTRYADLLAGRDTWIFSSGPTDEGDPVELTDGWTYPKPLQATIERIAPRDVRLFHGKLDPEELGLFERWVVRAVKAPVGDYRDPSTIAAWAREIAATLVARPATSVKVEA
ncbi:MAG: flavodoxin domain-containing protein [Trueperaceae bacterium]|nr:flavodoxin domain-containing protein [Trueperaceae bacterium]